MQKDLIATRSPGMPQGFGVGLAIFSGTRKTLTHVFLRPKQWNKISHTISKKTHQKKPPSLFFDGFWRLKFHCKTRKVTTCRTGIWWTSAERSLAVLSLLGTDLVMMVMHLGGQSEVS